MKRLLAALLALSMMFYVAPLNALAASDDDFSQTITVNSQPDADLMQAIASDPFLVQTDSALQEQKATVDTSNMSMEATSSFGRLLLKGINEENDAAANAVSDIRLNGRTATVTYRVEKDADLVVGVYADADEEQMVASGTVAVTATTDGTATVAITGDLPEEYVIKGYLFEKGEEHAPLCDAYRGTSKKEVKVDLDDLKDASIDDFKEVEDRVINLDTDDKTNFAVVNEEVTLLTAEDASAGKNDITQQDNDNLNYKIDNASDEIKNLQPGDILTYEYAPGEMLIVKVDTIDVSGDSVSIHGDDSLEITDVFDALKIETAGNTGDFDFTPADGVKDLGETKIDESVWSGDSAFDVEEIGENAVDETNAIEGSLGGKIFKEISFNKEFDKKLNEGSKSDDKNPEGKVSFSGSIKFSIDSEFKVYITAKKQSFEMNTDWKATGDISVSGSLNVNFVLGQLGFMPAAGLCIEIEPTIVESADVKVSANITAQLSVGTKYENGTFTDTSKAPKVIISGGVEGSLQIGFDLRPRIKAIGSVVTVELTAEIGAKAEAKKNRKDIEISMGNEHPKSIHECDVCYSIDLSIYARASVKIGLFEEIEHVAVSASGKLFDETFPLEEAYYSPQFKDGGKGKCPHNKYRMTVIVEDEDVKESDMKNVDIIREDTGEKVGEFNGSFTTYVYLPDGEYQLKAVIGNHDYTSAKFTVNKAGFEIWLGVEKEEVSFSGNGWTYLKNATLIIEDDAAFSDKFGSYYKWYEFRKSIKNLIVKSGVTKIAQGAFWGCTSLTRVTINESVISIDSDAFRNCTSLSSVILPESIQSIGGSAFYGCSSLTQVEIPSSVTSIGGGAFRGCGSLTEITIPSGVTSIGNLAFYGCRSLTRILLPESLETVGGEIFNESGMRYIGFAGSREQWKSIMTLTNTSDKLVSSTIHCADGDTRWNGTEWVDTEATYYMADMEENSIFESQLATENAKSHAVFNGLTAGESYAVIVSKSSEHPFEAGNLIYVNQKAADENGVLDVAFISDKAGEAQYVVACRDEVAYQVEIKIGDDTVETLQAVPGVTVKIEAKAMLDDGREFQKWNVDAGGVELADVTSAKTTFIMGSEDVVIHAVYKSNSSSGGETKPEQPDKPSSSSSAPSSTPSSSSSASSSSSSAPSSTPSSSSSASSSSSSAPSSTPSSSSSASSSSSSAPSSTPSSSSSVSSSSSSASSSKPSSSSSVSSSSSSAPSSTPSSSSSASSSSSSAPSSTPSSSSSASSSSSSAPSSTPSSSSSASSSSSSAPSSTPSSSSSASSSSSSAPSSTPSSSSSASSSSSSAPSSTPSSSSSASSSSSSASSSTPNTPAPSNNDDGGGAIMAVILLGGAAAAVTAGVVLMMPVEVSGVAQLSDGSVLANATVQVMKDGEQVAQTTTDGNGHFALEVKRGDYQMNVITTDPATGEQVVRTTSIKAPAKDTNIVF